MIKANLFYKEWINTIKENIINIQSTWDNSPEYTKLIIKDDNSIVMQIAKKLNLFCYNADYYSIDSIFYNEKGRLSEYKYPYLRHIEIAFEHENYFFSGLYQEVCHLLITNANLKVLVSYPQSLDLENPNNVQTELKYLHGLITESPDADKISEQENFLLILGCNDISALDKDNFNISDYWKGLVYKKDCWKEIK